MVTEYNYNENDFVSVTEGDAINLVLLQENIKNDSNITTNLSYVGRTINGSSYTIILTFDDTLNAEELTVLNLIVSNYTDDPEINNTFFIVKDIKSVGTNGGTFTKGQWVTRELNYIKGSDEYVTLNNNIITLQSGSYTLFGRVPACAVNNHQARLRNITDGTYIYGSNADSSKNSMTTSDISAYISIKEQKTFDIQHRCSKTSKNTGFGKATGFESEEIYTFLTLQRTN